MKIKLLKRVSAYIKPYKLQTALTLISAIISVGLQVIAPLIIGFAVDYIAGVNSVNFAKLIKICGILISAIIISSVFNRIMIISTNKLAFYTVRDIREQAFAKLNNVPLNYIDTNAHGDIMSKLINDCEQMCDGLLQGFTQLFSGVITIIGTLGLMLSIDLRISTAVILITPLSLAVAYFITRKSHTYFQKLSTTRGELSGFVEEMLGNQKTVKALCHETEAEIKFEEINEKLYKNTYKAQLLGAYINPSTRFVNGLVFACVGILGAVAVVKGSLTVGTLSCFLAYSQQYTKPFNEISGVMAELQAALVSAERIFDLIDAPAETETGHIDFIDCDGKVNFDNVSFSYNSDVKLIENLTLNIDSGKRVAIVGPTGSGKTTLINLLMRFYETDFGNISVSDIPITDLTRNTLRSCYGMVLQDTWLFNGTIRENISYGKPNASDKEIISAAKSAHIHDYIIHLENGYDTIINEEGDNISEGQKQLLCIARIMLTSPPMLILDEATSNIDTLTEIKIQQAFKEMMKGRTSFVVAHRLSTIKEADTILVMRNGKIVEQGNHLELLAKNGFYSGLYNSQF